MFKFELFTLDADDVGNISMLFRLSTLLSVPRNLQKEKIISKTVSGKGKKRTHNSWSLGENFGSTFSKKTFSAWLTKANNYKPDFQR